MIVQRTVLLLFAVSLTLLKADDDVIKCPGGECVKLHLCRDGELITDGAGLIDIRFNPEDPCEHYLLKCCRTEDGEEIIVPPSSGGGVITNPQTHPTDNGGHGVPPDSHGEGKVPGGHDGTHSVGDPTVVGVPGCQVGQVCHGGSPGTGPGGVTGQDPQHGGTVGCQPGQACHPETAGGSPGHDPNAGGVTGCQQGQACHGGPVVPGSDVDHFGSGSDHSKENYVHGTGLPGTDPSSKDQIRERPGVSGPGIQDTHDGSGVVQPGGGIPSPDGHCQGNQCAAPDHGNGSPVPVVTVGPPVTTETEGCGFRNADGVGFRITGNTDGESEYGEFPWMVAILKEEKALDEIINVYQCGGSLIHPQVVLTAAHCVQNKRPNEIKIRLGEWDTQTINEMYDHQDRNVVDMVVHEQFYKGGLFNDVALLFLDFPADVAATVNTVCLPPQDFNFDHNRCFASGWGKDVFGKEGKYQVILKKIELPIMPSDQCQNALRTTRLGKRFLLNKSFICAGGEPGRDTCKGDGGSPLVCPIPGTNRRFYQAGIVAWGIGCGETGIPGVYVKVAGFRKWIDDHLTQRNIPHTYYIPV